MACFPAVRAHSVARRAGTTNAARSGRWEQTPWPARPRETSKPSFSEIVVTRATDPLSVELLDHLATGTAYESAEIHVPTGAFLSAWCLSDVLLSGYSVSSSGDGTASESLSLNYVEITQQVGTAFVTYDLATGATSSESLCS